MFSGLMGIFRALFGLRSTTTISQPDAPTPPPEAPPAPSTPPISPPVDTAPEPAPAPEPEPPVVPVPPASPTATLIEDTAGQTRDLPISTPLREVLIHAATEAGIDLVRVTSGGQCAKGTCTKRVGSTRHDLGGAADLELEIGGRLLNMDDPVDRPIFAQFLQACARLGATGIGAAPSYMGLHRAHVGYGSRAVWGAGGKAANAPDWVKQAVLNGWNQASGGFETMSVRIEDLDSDDEELETDF